MAAPSLPPSLYCAAVRTTWVSQSIYRHPHPVGHHNAHATSRPFQTRKLAVALTKEGSDPFKPLNLKQMTNS